LARYIGSVCRLCRRENLKMFLKGDRCYSDKCAFDRRSYPPGQHGQRRGRKISDYGIQLREKQKVKRMYFVNSRTQGRHFVGHNHFLVNGRKVNISSYLTKIGDVVEIREKSRKIQAIGDSLDTVVRRGIPQWLDLEKENLRGIVKGFPTREDITTPIQEQLIVELYSK